MRYARRVLWVLATVAFTLMRAFAPPPRRAHATTGPAHGKDAEFHIDDGSDVLRDVSPYVRDVSFAVAGQTVDVSGFQSTGDWRIFLGGLRGATITISGVLDDTALIGSSVVMALDAVNSQRGFQYGPLGISAGEPKITAECIVDSVDWNAGVEVESTFSWTLQVTGAVTIGVQS